MKSRLGLLAAVAAVAVALGAQSAAATAGVHLSGGGTASISQVAMNVTFDGAGSASGTFNCLMAGRSAFIFEELGLPLSHIMKVQATATEGSISGSTATFSRAGFLIMDNGQRVNNIHILVWVDVASQRFQLRVIEVGAMPVETFSSGGVAMK